MELSYGQLGLMKVCYTELIYTWLSFARLTYGLLCFLEMSYIIFSAHLADFPLNLQ